ncbi:hypothetical protein FO499_11360 [Bacillus anthracis]|uniref:Uncharacterized protein n=1 Tax=Bacillus thuringiensis TaxID=1428 RepID=A0A437SG87_BACTU|nr:hypothetical protein GBN83_20105 [Bacillus sp. B3-WWTP-C-10-D-3]MDR4407112.1 hypothetical protein [Bacillus anthracis]RVU62027.1 hypothetical protein BM74_22705 [Bacillus thuringiensis]RXG08369.1 hypothetical protein EO768_16115 [Bacillus cereus]
MGNCNTASYDFTILILYIGKSMLMGGEFILLLEVYSRYIYKNLKVIFHESDRSFISYIN